MSHNQKTVIAVQGVGVGAEGIEGGVDLLLKTSSLRLSVFPNLVELRRRGHFAAVVNPRGVEKPCAVVETRGRQIHLRGGVEEERFTTDGIKVDGASAAFAVQQIERA